MKRITLLLALLVFSIITVSAQTNLTATKWKGVAYIPDAAEVILSFTKDSVVMLRNNDPLETMHYTLSGDTLSIAKLSGMSPCGQNAGTYKLSIKNNTLFLEAINDDCNERMNAFSPEGYFKQTE